MAWFPVGRNDSPGWRADAVSLVAVLGESLMARHLQPLSASRLCLLPRLIPAPQSFLTPTRAQRLPSPPATACGVHSGTLIHELNYFANVLHPIENLSAHQVTVYSITWGDIGHKHEHWDILPAEATSTRQVKTRLLQREALIRPRLLSPINILTMFSFLLTLGAFIWAIRIQDGPAVVALIAMPSASTLVGIASHWKPRLATRPSKALVPDGDIVIRTRDGAFIIVKCSEEIAREIYMGPEECNFLVGDQWFRRLVGFSMLLVIVSVLLLGNCNWTMQTVVAVIYIVLNGLYWVASLLPRNWLWDLSRYKCEDVTPGHLKDAHRTGRDGQAPSYTRSLWYAIQVTEEVDWVTISGAAPKTSSWEEWLRLAYIHRGDQNWDAVAEKDKLMKQAHSQMGSTRSQQFHQQDEEVPAIIPTRR